MRIIITDNGQIVMKKLSSSQSCPDLNGKVSSTNLDDSKSIRNKYQGFQENSLSIFDDNKSSQKNIWSSYNSISSTRFINIRKKNLKIPSVFLKKYEEKKNETPLVKQSSMILSELENGLSNLDKNRNNSVSSKFSNSRLYSGISNYLEANNASLPKIRSQYSVKEIVNKDCFDKLNKKLTEKIDNEKYDLKIDHRILRKEFSPEKIFDIVAQEKNKCIDSTNYKLIEYLMKKTSITDKFLKRINDANDNNLMEMDKMSSKVLLDKEKRNNVNKKIRENLILQKEKETEEFRKMLIKIKNKVNDNIIDDHMDSYKLVKDSNKGVYRNVFKMFRRQYWKKADNFARYFPKDQRVHYKEI